MKTYNKYIALAAFAFGLAACTQEENFAPQSSDIVQIASAHIATEVQSRVNTEDAGDAFDDGDAILLVNTSRTDKNEGTYTYTITDNKGTWSLTGGMVLWASGTEDNSFEAYYPASDNDEYEFPTDQSTLAGLKLADRMTATAENISKGSAVALSFSHVNAKVTITVVMNDEYNSDVTVSDLTIGGISPYRPENSTTYSAILQPTNDDFTVNLKVGTDDLTATCSTDLEAGKHYTFTLKVGKDAVTLGTVNVEEWGTTDPLADGEATEIHLDYTVDKETNSYYVYTATGLQQVLDLTDEVALIKIMADMELSSSITRTGNYTLDLNDKHIKVAATGLTITNGTVTIQDSGTTGIFESTDGYAIQISNMKGALLVKSGTIKATGAAIFSSAADKINIEGGTILGGTTGIHANKGTVTITGGTISGNTYAVSVNKTLTIEGGEFSNTDSKKAVIYSVGTATIKNDPTLDGPGADFYFSGGTLELSAATADSYKIFANTTEITGITLPAGWAIYDSSNNQVTAFTKGQTYTARATTEAE